MQTITVSRNWEFQLSQEAVADIAVFKGNGKKLGRQGWPSPTEHAKPLRFPSYFLQEMPGLTLRIVRFRTYFGTMYVPCS